MKKIRLLIALIAAILGSVQGTWAERVAPIFPEAQTLESGKTYYLYNVGSGRFIYRDGSDERGSTTTKSAVYITDLGDGTYTIQYYSNDYYFYATNERMQNGSSPSTNYRRFRITATEGGYYIQRNNNYDASQYVVDDPDCYYIRTDHSSGNIVWQLLDVEETDYYCAKKALYNALEAASGYEFAIAEYEAIYENEASTTEELNNAANSLNHIIRITKQATPNWTEYPVFIEGNWNESSKISKCIYGRAYYGGETGNLTSPCKATVIVDENATLIYQYSLESSYSITGYGSSNKYDGDLRVYLDGEEVQTIGKREGWDKVQNYFVELTPGTHVIEWIGTCLRTDENVCYFALRNIGVQKTPTITVNLTQAGSLGTEVLYNVDHLKDVRKLVIKGYMNDEDWARVNMMTGLFELDLTDANIENIPKVNPGSYFHKVKLPRTLKSIGNQAFYFVTLDEITFPETLESIGSSAFEGTRIKDAIIPENVISINGYAFAHNQSLLKVQYPLNVTTIPSNCFAESYSLNDIVIHDGVNSIGERAFYKAYRVNTSIPSTVKSIGKEAFLEVVDLTAVDISDNVTIGEDAFEGCTKLKNVTIGKNCTIGRAAFWNCTALEKVNIDEGSSFSNSSTSYYYTFYGCSSLKEIVFPTTFYQITWDCMLQNCTGLGNGGIVTFKSPTMVSGSSYKQFFKDLNKNITIRVPNFLVNTYKLDSYWYNYNIEGFSTADITDWTINSTLTFGSQDRFEGTPNVILNGYGTWTINGETPQNIENIIINAYSQQYGGWLDRSGKVISTCSNVNVNGFFRYSYNAYNNIKNSPSYGRWHFICLPFDIKVSDINCTNNARFAIRYYDGANRAANGTGGNWKDYASDAIIPAGTGFIIQVSKDCWIEFYSLNNESKQYAFSNSIFSKALDANVSEQSSNKGWNLVGNPCVCYYNIHKLNFTGAITVYDGYNRTYKAYSIIDDDYAILPNQAFFVQCPDEVTEISFPVDGRQMTSVIESQNGAKELEPQAQTRWLVDVELSDGEQSDKTRFVLNDKASMTYETSCDASKFFEDGTACPQFYTIEAGVPLAINERPMSDGTVALGMTVAQSGTYTISTPRNDFLHIWLIDLETGKETDLCNGSYTFRAEAGTDETRFMLSLNESSIPTGIDVVKSNTFGTSHTVFTLDGRQTKTPTQKGIYIVDGKKVIVK